MFHRSDKDSSVLASPPPPKNYAPFVPAAVKAVNPRSKYVIPKNAIRITSDLGQGEFGSVKLGIWTNDAGAKIKVAIKFLSQLSNQTEVVREAMTMQELDHNNLVKLYGIVLDHEKTLMLVTEYAPHRSLSECLCENSSRIVFTVNVLCHFAEQISEGMAYLEMERIIHRDLAARNVLVFSPEQVKISDFGLSKPLRVEKDYYQTNLNVSLQLPIAWCAPECIKVFKFSSASDVWSFGVVLWEMFSYGKQPWGDLRGLDILDAVDEPVLRRLEKPEYAPTDHYKLMEHCWQHLPDNRPSFAKITQVLPKIRPTMVISKVVHRPANPNQLAFQIGDHIIVLDKSDSYAWKGVCVHTGQVGIFNPLRTTASLPASPPYLFRSFRPLTKSRSQTLRPSPGEKPVEAFHFRQTSTQSLDLSPRTLPNTGVPVIISHNRADSDSKANQDISMKTKPFKFTRATPDKQFLLDNDILSQSLDSHHTVFKCRDTHKKPLHDVTMILPESPPAPLYPVAYTLCGVSEMYSPLNEAVSGARDEKLVSRTRKPLPKIPLEPNQPPPIPERKPIQRSESFYASNLSPETESARQRSLSQRSSSWNSSVTSSRHTSDSDVLQNPSRVVSPLDFIGTSLIDNCTMNEARSYKDLSDMGQPINFEDGSDAMSSLGSHINEGFVDSNPSTPSKDSERTPIASVIAKASSFNTVAYSRGTPDAATAMSNSVDSIFQRNRKSNFNYSINEYSRIKNSNSKENIEECQLLTNSLDARHKFPYSATKKLKKLRKGSSE